MEVTGQGATLFVGDDYVEVPKRVIGVSAPAEILRWRGIHGGCRAILIGNGESAKTSRLQDVPRSGENRVWTIGLNKAWKLGKWDYNAMGDQRQLHDFEQERGSLEQLDPLFTTHASGRKVGTRIQGRTSDIKYLSFDALHGFYLNNTITAYGIQLALWMGFTTIYLIGIDAYGRHFYGGEPIPENKFSNQRETMGLFAGILRERRPDVKVLNLSLNSHIRVFPKVRFEKVFKP